MEKPEQHSFTSELGRMVRPRCGGLFDYEICSAFSYYKGHFKYFLLRNGELNEEELDKCYFYDNNNNSHIEWKKINKNLFDKTDDKKNYRVWFPINNGNWLQC